MLRKWADGRQGTGGFRYLLMDLQKPSASPDWELLSAHHPNGDIPIANAAQTTLWINQWNFSDLDNLDLRFEFVDGNAALPFSWTDLNGTPANDDVLFQQTGVGEDFTQDMVGQQIILFNGTGLNPRVYRILEYISVNAVRVDGIVGNGPGDGFGKLIANHQELEMEENAGVISLKPYVVRYQPGEIWTLAIFTVSTPAAAAMRIYHRAEGALTYTTVSMYATLTPEGCQ